MAEIPVTKRGGAMWLLWLLAAIIAVVLLIWLFNMRDDDAEVGMVEEGIVAEAPAGPITEINTILGADRSTLIGRQVMLEGVTVQSVVSDRVFYVGDGAQQLAIVLNQVPTPGTPTEGRYDVTPGQVITVNGVISRVDESAVAMNALPTGTDVVVEANSLNILQRAG